MYYLFIKRKGGRNTGTSVNIHNKEAQLCVSYDRFNNEEKFVDVNGKGPDLLTLRKRYSIRRRIYRERNMPEIANFKFNMIRVEGGHFNGC